MGKSWCLTLCLLGVGSAFGANVPSFTFSNQPGTHAVGLRVVLQYDYARTYRSKVDLDGQPFRGQLARPIQTLIWYPAQKSSAAQMTYGDYLGLFATEENFSPTPTEAAQSIREAEKSDAFSGNPASAMWAVRDAKPESGIYPLVIYAPSFSAPAFENADLCEYLASHGYVVIASPDMGAHTRGMTKDLEGIDAQADDISFLIGFARSIPQADLSHIAVMGFSWGGISNFFAAAKDHRITALIALDGSARYFPGLIKDSKYVHPENMSLPLLFFTSNSITLEKAIEFKFDFSSGDVLNQMTHSDVYVVHMHEMRHGEFSSSYQRSPDYWKLMPPGEYSPQETSESYGWMARYTLQFLNAIFKQDSAAAVFLGNPPVKNGVPAHMLALDFREAKKGIVPTIEGLAAALGKQGFNHASEVYAEAKSQNPDMKISEAEIDTWGQGLVSQNHMPEAIEVLKLNVSLYPNSANVYDSLGQAYEMSGQKELAIDNYKKSLEKDPGNEDAKIHLSALQAESPSGR